jgi:hypothetical protein
MMGGLIPRLLFVGNNGFADVASQCLHCTNAGLGLCREQHFSLALHKPCWSLRWRLESTAQLASSIAAPIRSLLPHPLRPSRGDRAHQKNHQSHPRRIEAISKSPTPERANPRASAEQPHDPSCLRPSFFFSTTPIRPLPYFPFLLRPSQHVANPGAAGPPSAFPPSIELGRPADAISRCASRAAVNRPPPAPVFWSHRCCRRIAAFIFFWTRRNPLALPPFVCRRKPQPRRRTTSQPGVHRPSIATAGL